MSFNFLGLGSTLVIQKASKVKNHICVLELWKYSCGIYFDLRCINTKDFQEDLSGNEKLQDR